MKSRTFTNHLKQSFIAAAGLAMIAPAAIASIPAPWMGDADYKLAPGASSIDEDKVLNFDTYDFGIGVALIKLDQAGPGTIEGWYQSRVTGHSNSVDFSQPQSPNLNTLGSGTGYELTGVAHFTGSYSNIGTTQFFTITNGEVALYFDTTPDSNFVTDSGFNSDLPANGSRILWGTINSGEGNVKTSGTNAGSGFEELDLNFGGAFGGYDHAVYDPDTIGGGDAIFTIKTKGVSLLTTVNSVQGISKIGGALFAADGNLQLTAVPLPTAVWLFGAGFMGLLAIGKRKQFSA